jgi:hypothetical protein
MKHSAVTRRLIASTRFSFADVFLTVGSREQIATATLWHGSDDAIKPVFVKMYCNTTDISALQHTLYITDTTMSYKMSSGSFHYIPVVISYLCSKISNML